MRECWNGRQARLRCVCPRRMGSSPISRTRKAIKTFVLVAFLFCIQFNMGLEPERVFALRKQSCELFLAKSGEAGTETRRVWVAEPKVCEADGRFSSGSPKIKSTRKCALYFFIQYRIELGRVLILPKRIALRRELS